MMDCRFVIAGPGLRRCAACGFSLASQQPPERIHRNCPATIVARDAAAIAALEAVCRSNECGAFDAIRGTCRLCGCPSSRAAAWQSKLRVGQCPRGRWPVAVPKR